MPLLSNFSVKIILSVNIHLPFYRFTGKPSSSLHGMIHVTPGMLENAYWREILILTCIWAFWNTFLYPYSKVHRRRIGTLWQKALPTLATFSGGRTGLWMGWNSPSAKRSTSLLPLSLFHSFTLGWGFLLVGRLIVTFRMAKVGIRTLIWHWSVRSLNGEMGIITTCLPSRIKPPLFRVIRECLEPAIFCSVQRHKHLCLRSHEAAGNLSGRRHCSNPPKKLAMTPKTRTGFCHWGNMPRVEVCKALRPRPPLTGEYQ